MKSTIQSDKAFTLVEMLTVVTIIGILAALILPALSAATNKARRMTCLDDVKQITTAVQMYIDDSSDTASGLSYKEKVRSYLGLQGRSSPQDRVFACPADTSYYYPMPNDFHVYFTNSPARIRI